MPTPPGGFRFGIINVPSISTTGFAARRELAKSYPDGSIFRS